MPGNHRNHTERDELRDKLLLALQENCARPNKDYAYDLHIDASSLSRLKEKLEKEGIIKSYKAVLNAWRSHN